MIKLKACPFCGKKDELIVAVNVWDMVTAKCKRCRIEGPPSTTSEEAAQAWNTRAPERRRTAAAKRRRP